MALPTPRYRRRMERGRSRKVDVRLIAQKLPPALGAIVLALMALTVLVVTTFQCYLFPQQ